MFFRKLMMLLVAAGLAVALHGVSFAEDGKSFMADKHQAEGVKCAACHAEGEKKSKVSMDKCVKCHESYEKVATKTANMERNPHTGHFVDLQCTTCHHGHKQSENYCGTCHKVEPMH